MVLAAGARVANKIEVNDRIKIMLAKNGLAPLSTNIDTVELNVFGQKANRSTIDANDLMISMKTASHESTKSATHTRHCNL